MQLVPGTGWRHFRERNKLWSVPTFHSCCSFAELFWSQCCNRFPVRRNKIMKPVYDVINMVTKLQFYPTFLSQNKVWQWHHDSLIECRPTRNTFLDVMFAFGFAHLGLTKGKDALLLQLECRQQLCKGAWWRQAIPVCLPHFQGNML